MRHIRHLGCEGVDVHFCKLDAATRLYKTVCKSHPFPGISFQALQLSNTVRVKRNAGGLNIVQPRVLPCIVMVVYRRQRSIVHGFACWNASPCRLYDFTFDHVGFVLDDVLEML